jgi:hypothetical protein
MSGEIEAAGALATAGAVAGAIEGREGGAPGEGACLNCGAKLEGRFCSQCGQHAQAHRKLTHVLEEFLHGVLHFDTKTWRTFPMIVARPGTLTRNYVYGKRARYLSPLTMFLFSVFLMFFVFSFFDAPIEGGGSPARNAATAEQLADAREELAQAQAELARVRANPSPDEPAGLEQGLAEGAVRIAEAQVERIERQLAAQEARAVQAGADAPAPDAARQEENTWRDEVRQVALSDDFVVVDGMPALNERVRRTLSNPDLAMYRIQEAASQFSFLLAPLSLPFIVLLFLWRRGVTLYDHMAYALYALAFASLLFVTVVLTAQHAWTSWLPAWLVGVGLPAHTFFHLKGAYALGWFSALWRTIFMLTFALIIALVFLALVVVLGLVG